MATNQNQQSVSEWHSISNQAPSTDNIASRRSLIPISFAIVIIFFFFNFFTVKCGEKEIASAKGIDLITGIGLSTKDMFNGRDLKGEKMPPNIWAIISFGAAIIGLGAFLLKAKTEAKIGSRFGAIGFISLIVLMFSINQSIEQKTEGQVYVSFQFAYWGALIAMGIATLISYLRIRRTAELEISYNKKYALPIAMMFALFFMIAFVTGLTSPMGGIVANQFGASNFLSQLGFFTNFIAYAFMGVPAGILLERIGYKKTALIAVVVGFTGIVVQYLSGQIGSFVVYLSGAFISGFSMCMLNTVVNPMLNTLGGGGKKGNQLIQTGGSLNLVAATIVPVLVGYLMGANNAELMIDQANPALFIAMGIFAMVFVVLFIMEIPEPRLLEKVKIKHEHSPLSFRHFIFGAIAIFVYVGIEIGILQLTFLFMIADAAEGGLAIVPTIASFLVGTYLFLMIIGRILGALLGDELSSKSMLTIAACICLIFIFLAIILPISSTIDMPVFQSDFSFGLAHVPIGIMFLIFCGLCTSVMWGSIFNLAVEGLGKYTEAASGIFMTMVVGGGILPLIQNAVADNANYMVSYWVPFLGLAYLLYYALIGSKNVNTDIPVDVV